MLTRITKFGNVPIAILALLCLAGVAPEAEAQGTGKPFQHEAFNIVIPRGWEATKNPEEGFEIGFADKKVSGATWYLHYQLMPANAGPPPSDPAMLRRMESQFDTLIGQQFPGAKKLSPPERKLPGARLVHLLHEVEADGQAVLREYVYVVAHNTAYVLQCTTPKVNQAKSKSAVDMLFRTFQLRPGAQPVARTSEQALDNLRKYLPKLASSMPVPWRPIVKEVEFLSDVPNAADLTLLTVAKWPREELIQEFSVVKEFVAAAKRGQSPAESVGQKHADLVQYAGQFLGFAVGEVHNLDPPVTYLAVRMLDAEDKNVGIVRIRRTDLFDVIARNVQPMEAAALYEFISPGDSNQATKHTAEAARNAAPGTDKETKPGDLPFRIWTSSDGRKVEAAFVELKDGKVVLQRKSDGKTFALPLNRFREADQQWVKQRVKARRVKLAARLIDLPEYAAWSMQGSVSRGFGGDTLAGRVNLAGFDGFRSAAALMSTSFHSIDVLQRRIEEAREVPAAAKLASSHGVARWTVVSRAAASRYDIPRFFERTEAARQGQPVGEIASRYGVAQLSVILAGADCRQEIPTWFKRVEEAGRSATVNELAGRFGVSNWTMILDAADSQHDVTSFLERTAQARDSAEMDALHKVSGLSIKHLACAAADSPTEPQAFLESLLNTMKDPQAENLSEKIGYSVETIGMALSASSAEASDFFRKANESLEGDRAESLSEQLGVPLGRVVFSAAASESSVEEFFATFAER